MKDNHRVLGVIPARAGSKGIQKKNLRPVLGEPLVAWTVRQALASSMLSEVCISTDCPDVTEVALAAGGSVPFRRPSELATDDALTSDVVIHALDFYAQRGDHFGYVALLEPTSPLRAEGDIDGALEQLIDGSHQYDSVVSVAPMRDHPQIAMRINGSGQLSPFSPSVWRPIRRQDLDEAFFPFVAVHAARTESFRRYRTFYQPRTLPYVLEPWQAYEIDEPNDLVCVEAMLREFGVKNGFGVGNGVEQRK